MSCSKTFTITVNDGECAFIDDLVWAVLFPFPPDGIKSGSGDGGTFEAFCSTTAADPDAALVTLSTSFAHESGNINLRVRFDTVIDASPGTAFGRLNLRRNGVLIFTQIITTSGTRDFYFQLTDADTGATYAIDIPVRCNDYSGADKSITINGTIECVDSVVGVGNEQQQGDYDCEAPQCTGPGGHVTIPAGTWFRDTLGEANAAALAFAENQAFNISVCCCTNWSFGDEETNGGTLIHNGSYLSSPYGITTDNSSGINHFTGQVIVPECAIPPGSTNIVVTINYSGFGVSGETYILDYYDQGISWASHIALASSYGDSGSVTFSRPIASGTGVFYGVQASEPLITGTGTVTITFT